MFGIAIITAIAHTFTAGLKSVIKEGFSP